MKDKGATISLAARVRALVLFGTLACAACAEGGGGNQGVEPKTMRDVPAARLFFDFQTDVGDESNVPQGLAEDESVEKIEAIRQHFETTRPAEELLRTASSPDGQRALALYATSETEGYDFRMDLYSTEGVFLRNILPRNINGTFPDEVAWSPDGSQFAFVGIRNPSAEATPDPGRETSAPPVEPEAAPGAVAAPTVAPVIAPVAVYKTEQVYVSDRDGIGIRPITTRDGLIHFKLSWAPDGHALAALACLEEEWSARRAKGETPAGRPRIITPNGEERLLDDRLADAAPAWSPDSSKIATAFDKTVAIFDAAGAQPTSADIPLAEPLWASSFRYDAKLFGKRESAVDENEKARGGEQNSGNEGAGPGIDDSGASTEVPPLGSVSVNSFNPVVRVVWTEPETIYVQTTFISQYPGEPFPTVRYLRWHLLSLLMKETEVSRNFSTRRANRASVAS